MKINGKELKYVKEEELNKYLRFMESSLLGNVIINRSYGDIEWENYKENFIKEWNKIHNKELYKPINVKNQCTATKEDLNKGKNVKVIDGTFKGFEGTIRDDCKLLDKYLAQLKNDEFNAIYVDKSSVEIIEDKVEDKEEWITKILKYASKDNYNYRISIEKDKIHVYVNRSPLFEDYIFECDIELCKEDLKLIQDACSKEFKREIAKYVISEINIHMNDKDLDEIAEREKEIQNKKKILIDKNEELEKIADGLFSKIESLVNK